jgi:acetolactate synthase-1/2/3 large subunit
MNKVKLSDYVASYLLKNKLRYIFSVTGAGSMHFNDAIGTKKGLKVVYTHHEQSAAMAAEGVARISGRPGVVNVSTGPGGTNAITGVAGAWVDSIPMFVISGQIMRKDRGPKHGLRQMGVQEIDTISVVKPLTKYAVTVEDPNLIKYHLDKALYYSMDGKPGPVWIELPLDIQSSFIDPKKLKSFKLKKKKKKLPVKQFEKSIKLINLSKKPIIICGYGVRSSKAVNDLKKLINKTKIPLSPSWNTIDVMKSSSDLVIGRAGLFGDRASNYAVQKCDLLIILGSRLSTAQIGYMDDLYAKNAKKIYVEIDRKELTKPTIKADLPINCNVKDYINYLLKSEIINLNRQNISIWRNKLINLKKKYPISKELKNNHKNYASSFKFVDDLCKYLRDDEIVVTDMGTSFTCTMQAFQAKNNQRLWTSSGLASMGYGLPATIGACISTDSKKRCICISGDGGMLFNLQELQTVIHHKLPIKIFLIDNDGYLTQKLMMAKNFRRFAGAHPTSGVSCPDFIKVAKSFGFKCDLINNDKNMPKKIKEIMSNNKPHFCVVKIHPMQPLTPRVLMKMRKDGSFERTGIESVSPFLNESEHLKNLKYLD